jgi:rRNA-processing protein EBP2
MAPAVMDDYSGDDVDLSESEDDESEDDTEKPVAEARRDAVYNAVGLHEKLEDIAWPEGIEWTHSLAVDYKHEGAPVDVNDDLTREMSFYTQGLECAREAYLKLQELDVPFLRPADYYAEMIKSDTHMLKIKDKLLFQKRQMEESEERRKQREAKKYGKEVQAERLKERAQQKKRDIEGVKKWRKGRSDSGFADGEEPFEVEGEGRPAKKQKVNASPWDRSGGKGAGGGRGGRGGGRGGRGSRTARDAKFGYGGRKGSAKRNSAESTADESGFKASFKGKSMGDRGGRGRGRGRGGGRGRGRGRS